MEVQLNKRRSRAISLLSGGLDSRLAAHVLLAQGIEVLGVAFKSPFFDDARAREAARTLGVPVKVMDFSADIVDILNHPKHGFGSCMNPCIDCHARMLKRAGELAGEQGFDFLSTGEVLDQRPMSQNRRSLQIVAMESGYPEIIVRPLSAQLLPETRPEREGLVDRSRLLAIRGRSRKEQMRMAGELGLGDYPTPAGGCRLTEPHFCARLRDLRDHEGIGDVRPLMRLRHGRHFRIAGRVKLVLGRNEQENALLEGEAGAADLVLRHLEVPGPSGLLPETASADQIALAASICARYGDCEGDRRVKIEVRSAGTSRTVEALPLGREEVLRYLIG